MTTASSAQLHHVALRGGFFFVTSKIAIQALQWVVTLVVARLLLPSDYGLMAIAAMIAELAGLIATAGFTNALVQRAEISPGLISQVFTLTLAFTVVVYACLWLAAPSLAAALGSPGEAFFLRVVSAAVWMVPIYAVSSALLERDLRLSSQAKSFGLSGILQAAVVFAAALAGAGAWSLAFGLLCGGASRTGLTWWQTRWRPRLAWPDMQTLELARFGMTIAMTSLLWFAYSNADKALISALLGPVALGLYAFAFQFISLPVDKITADINKIAFSVYCKLRLQPERLREWYLRLVSILFACFAPILVGAALIADDAIPLVLGEKWHALVAPFQLLAPVGAIMLVATTVSPLLNALGRPDIPLKYVVTCAATYLPAFFIAAKAYGLPGICAVWLVLYPLQTLGLLHASRHVTSISVPTLLKRLSPFLKSLALMALVVMFVRWYLGPASPLVRVVCSMVAGALAYAGLTALFLGRAAISRTFEFLKDLKSGNARETQADKLDIDRTAVPSGNT